MKIEISKKEQKTIQNVIGYGVAGLAIISYVLYAGTDTAVKVSDFKLRRKLKRDHKNAA